MIINKETLVTKDLANRKLVVAREFDAPLEQVWRAWTESELLDQWWAPKPWKAQTKSMNFKEGGHWLYQMIGPDGTGSWCLVEFKMIDTFKSFSAVDSFCDENGRVDDNFPSMYWNNEFSKTGDSTTVNVEIRFDTDAALEKILEMGFEEAFTAALGNLDELLAK